MFSIDSKNIAVLGGATAAFLAGVYVLWGPSEKKSSKRKRGMHDPPKNMTHKNTYHMSLTFLYCNAVSADCSLVFWSRVIRNSHL